MKKLIFALIAGTAAMGAAQAQSQMFQRPYVGIGMATADQEGSVPGATNADSDGYKANAKVFGGVAINDMFGVEVGHTDFREADVDYTFNGARGRATTDGRATYIAGTASMPVAERVAVFGKLGVAHTKGKLRASDPVLNRSESDNELYAAVGAEYKLNQKVALTAEYERYGKSKDFGPKADVWTIAAKYSF
ncbi:MAG TPA: porin family protein [Telluria sp.]